MINKIGLMGEKVGLARYPAAKKAYKILRDIPWLLRDGGYYEIQDFYMNLDPNSRDYAYRMASRTLIKDNGIELQTTRVFKQVVQKGDIVVDVGACLGYYTLLAASIIGMWGRVYAFEPYPDNFSKLKENVNLNGFDPIVNLNPVAVSNNVNQLDLYISRTELGCHTLRRNHDHPTVFDDAIGGEYVSVPTVKLDDYFKDFDVNVIKIDVEGWESFVIEGGLNTIERATALFLEYNPKIIRESGRGLVKYYDNLFLVFDTCYAITDLGDYDCNELIKVSDIHHLVDIASRSSSGVNVLFKKGGEL